MSEPTIPSTAASPETSEESAHCTQDPFARVTVIRVVGPSASKPGDRFIVGPDGELTGFTGGACVRKAVSAASLRTLQTGETRLVRAAPKARLRHMSEEAGIDLVANGCPSESEIDFFVEPVRPQPPLFVYGDTALSDMVATLGREAGFRVGRQDPAVPLPSSARYGFVVIATQGDSDRAALTTALRSDCPHVLFVASLKKAARMKEHLAGEISESRLAALIAPAGLDIGAAGPAEIAISIMAQLIQFHRRGALGK